jgi:hypothetical protein
MTASTAEGGMVPAGSSNQRTERNNKQEPLTDEQIKTMCNWLNAAVVAVFAHVQFLGDEEDEAFGSDWQREICGNANMSHLSRDAVSYFWRKRGMVTARKLLNRRRQNINTAMKKKFLGKIHSPLLNDGMLLRLLIHFLFNAPFLPHLRSL